MIKWIRKSLGRKAVLFVVVFILLMSLGIFQMMFYASSKGYMTADTLKNEYLCIPENDSQYGKPATVPYRIKIDEENEISA